MCSNFQPATPKQIAEIVDNQLELELTDYSSHVYPKDYCPIIIPSKQGLQIVRGQFGLSPKWASHPVDYSTYNARLESIESIESIESKKTFAPPFTHNQFCLVPMQAFFEPYYSTINDSASDKQKTSKNHWQKIHRQDETAFTIAGMFEYNESFDEPVYSFTLLTHNADDEAFMQRFHRPEKEKRSIYLVDADKRQDYLQANHKQITDLMSIIKGDSFTYEASKQK